jgi:hypothetical protein
MNDNNQAGENESAARRRDFVMERFGDLKDADRSFDIEFWQRQGAEAIFDAAWELAEFYHLDRGMRPDELRLQRSVEHFERK